MSVDECPDGPKLAAFSLGYLPDDEVDALAVHLEGCARCESVLNAYAQAPQGALAAVREDRDHLAPEADRAGSMVVGFLRQGHRDAPANPPADWTHLYSPPARVTAPEFETGSSGPRADRGGPKRLGDFLLVRELGRGGMGVVYEALQESLGRRVALKVLGSSLAHDRNLIERFRREAQAAARLHHTNIVAVFGVGEDDDVPYYVMQYIEGPGLDRVIDAMRKSRRRDAEPAETDLARRPTALASGVEPALPSTAESTGPTAVAVEDEDRPRSVEPPSGSGLSSPAMEGPVGLSLTGENDRDRWRAVARVGAQVASALHYAHEQRTLHRDIKPANLLLDGRGTVWVTDFGLAKVAEQVDMTRTGDIVGTIRYMAPERFRGVCDARSDVYSLGLTLYELIALRPGFEVRDKGKLIREVTEGSPPPLRQLVPGLPRDLEVVVHKAIEKAPGHRYRTAGELADDLRRFLDDRPIRARRVVAAERALRWCRRNPSLATLTAAVFALLLTVAVVSTYAAFRIGRNAREIDNARKDLRKFLYFSQMNLAQQAGEGADMAGLNELLEPWHAADPKDDLRGFEWYYWWGVAHKARATLTAHTQRINVVAYSNDGKLLASGADNGEVFLWPSASPDRKRPLRGAPGRILALAFSRDDSLLASGGLDGSVVLWETGTGRSVGRFPILTGRAVYGLAFLDDHTLIVLARDNVTYRFDTRTRAFGDEVVGDTTQGNSASDDHQRVHAIAADGLTVAIGCNDGEVKVRKAETAETWRTLAGPKSIVRSLAFSRNGRFIAVGYEDKSVRVWDVASGKPFGAQALAEHSGTPWTMAFGPSARTLVTGGLDNVIIVWDLHELSLTMTPKVRSHSLFRDKLKGHTNSVMAVAISPDGGTLASGSLDTTVRLWDISNRVTKDRLEGHEQGNDVLAISPDGSTLVSGSRDTTAKVWDVKSGRFLRTFRGHQDRVRGVAFLDNTTVMSVGWDGKVCIWDVITATPKGDAGTFRGDPDLPDGSLLALGVSRDGKTAAWASKDLSREFENRVTIWDVPRARVIGRFRTSGQSVWKLVFSADGSQLICGGFGKALLIYDVATCRLRDELDIGRSLSVQSLALSDDGRTLAAGCEDGRIILWDMPTREPLPGMTGHANAVSALVFSHDGRTLFSGGRDNAVKVWDVPTRRLKMRSVEHRNNVMDLALTPDGETLASASLDWTVRLWRTTPRDEVEKATGSHSRAK